jgi:CheY-like chemotaxis protein
MIRKKAPGGNMNDTNTVSGRRILVVEDEMMIRMLLEDMLSDLGYTIVAACGGIDEALGCAKQAEIDVAILDVNLSGTPVYPVADALEARGVPFLFSTGYGERGVADTYRDHPTLQKPFQMEGLERALKKLLDGAAP